MANNPNHMDNLVPLTSEKARELGKKSSNKGIPHSSTRLKRLLELTKNLENPITGEVEGFTVAEQMDLKQIIKALKGDTKAYTTIVDRLEGKPKETIDQNTKFDGTVQFINDIPRPRKNGGELDADND